ncbi:hypothetical protein R9C00_25860 [Flammeovirgaceae bacterium SG7u.111]|nr:hypothetical protein [Flammeovirgaceae bacterium SG7u.132]WPO35124.1 hypothetical protein R9C00_25860 [Flammeovirgaceae bacterium SG7u.111]
MSEENADIQEHSSPEENAALPKKKKRRWLRRVSWFVGIMLLLAVGAQLYVRYYTNEILGRVLKEVIQLKSDGLYKLDYESIRFSFFERELQLKELSLQRDSLRYEQLVNAGGSFNALVNIQIPNLYVNTPDLKKLYLENRLEVEAFRMDKPKVSIISFPHVGKVDSTFNDPRQLNDFFYIISGYLDLFRVESFEIDDAMVAFASVGATDTLNSFQLKGFSVDIKNFQIDSTNTVQSKRQFSVDGINVDIKENSFTSKDWLYDVAFGSLKLSTDQQYFWLDDFRLRSKKGSEGNQLDLLVSKLRIDELRYDSAYFYETFRAKALTLHKPIITYEQQNPLAKRGGGNPLPERLHQALSLLFPKFTLSSLSLDSAAFDLTIGKGKSADNLNLDNFTLDVENFSFDSLNYKQRGKKYFVDNADLVVNNYSLDLPDGLHTLKVFRMGISTSKKHFFTSNFYIGARHKRGNKARLKKANKDKLLDIYFSRVELQGLDIWDFVQRKSLVCNKIDITRPKVEVNKYKMDAPPPPLPSLPDSVLITSRRPKLLPLDSLVLPELVTAPSELPRYDPELQDSLIFMMDVDSILATIPDTLPPPKYGEPVFTFDSFYFSHPYTLALAPPSMLPTQDDYSELVVADSLLRLFSPEVKKEILARRKRRSLDSAVVLIDLSAASILPTDTLGDIIGNSLIAKGLDSIWMQLQDSSMINLFDSPTAEHVDADSLLMARIYPLISKVFTLVDVGGIEISDADFDLNEIAHDTTSLFSIEEAQVYLNDLLIEDSTYLDSGKVLFTSSFEVKANQVSLKPGNGLHTLQIDNPFVSSADSLVSASSIRISPTNRNRGFVRKVVENIGPLYDVSLFDFRLEGFGMRDFIYNQEVRVGLLQIKRPNFMRFSSPIFEPNQLPDTVLLAQELDTLKKEIPLHKLVRVLEVQRINISSGTYGLIELGERASNRLSGNQVSLCVRGLEMDTVQVMEGKMVFDAEDFEVFTKNHRQLLADDIHLLEVKELGVSLSGSYVFAYGADLAPKPGVALPDSASTYRLSLPMLRLDEFDLRSFYLDKEAVVGQMRIWEPQINLDLFAKEDSLAGPKEKFRLEDLPQQLTASLKLLNVQKFLLDRGRLNLAQHKEGKTSTISTGFIKLGVENLFIDSATELSADRFLYSDDVSLQIKNYVHYLPDSSYSIRASEVGYSTHTAEFYATYLHFAPDIWADPTFNDKREDKRELFELYTPRIALSGIGSYGIYKGDSLGLGSIQLQKPKFRVVTYAKDDGEEAEPFAVDSIYSAVAKVFPDVNIGKFEMGDISLELVSHGEKESKHIKLKDIHTGFTHFEVDEEIARSDSRFLHADDFYLKLKNYHYILPDSLHSIDLGEVGFSTGEKLLYVDKFRFNTTVGKYEIGEIMGHETDWMNFKADRIALKNFQFDSLVVANKIMANQLDVNKLSGDIFRDKRPPFPKNNKPPLPQEAIKNLSTYLKIDTVFIHRSRISYEELAVGGKQTGKIDFLDMNIWGYNLTNDSVAVANNEAFQLYASTEVMGNGHLDAAFNFQLGSEKNAFTYQAELHEMDLRRLNPILENVAFAKINGGTAKKLLVKVQADDEYADGIMKFYYNDLKVTLINKETQKTGFGLGIASFLANSLVVKSDNPRFLFLKRGKIYFERIEHKSVINYLVKTLLSGVKHSVGLSYEKPPKERKKSFFEFWKGQRKGF